MKRIILTAVAVLLIAFNVTAQTDTLKWINKNARDLSNLSFLKKELKDKYIVGLGEASHGTREFYTEKTRIISYLVENCGFKTLAFEAPDSLMMQINSFVQNEKVDIKAILSGMGLYGSQEIYELFLKLRDYNKQHNAGDRVKLTGFDKPAYWSDPISRDRYMSQDIIKMEPGSHNKIMLWAHNVHLQKDTTAQYLATGGFLRKHFGDRYFAIALDTYRGSVNVLSKGQFEAHDFQSDANTLSALMAKASLGRFYVRFDAARDPFKGKSMNITNIYSNWQPLKPIPIRPGVDVDAVIFIRDTQPSVQLAK